MKAVYSYLALAKTGKTTLLLSMFPNSRFYDLLENDTYERLRRNPSLLRQEIRAKIDSTQSGDFLRFLLYLCHIIDDFCLS